MRLFTDVSSRVADPWLRRAFTLAEKGRGTTSPNPVVGCVIVADGEVVGEGFHERAGGPHAEVLALGAAGGRARGATAYVTLEPCNHTGRTPPCTDALMASGVTRVVIGMLDPNPRVAGGGAEVLRSAGMEVVVAEDPTPFAIQNEAWSAVASTGDPTGTARPFVRAKVALSLDGRAALVEGERASITGEAGARVTRSLRERADAVLVGAATAIADDPALTVRNGSGALASRQPLRVVLCGSVAPPAQSKLFTDEAARTLVLAPGAAAAEIRAALPRHVEVVEYERGEGLTSALRALGESGVVDLLVEPGPRLFTALWEERLIDELVTVHAGGMAGRDAPVLFGGTPDRGTDGSCTLAHEMTPLETGLVGDVAVVVWRPAASVSGRPTDLQNWTSPSEAQGR